VRPPEAIQPRRLYDVAVLGPDVGGATTAALLARRGLRVVLVPDGPVGPKDSDGWLLPAAVPPLPPLRQLNGAASVLDELGLAQELQRQSAGPQGALQILGDGLRLALPAELVRRRGELRRELGAEDAERAEAALQSLEQLAATWNLLASEPPPLPPRGFFEKRKLRKVLPPVPELPQGFVGDVLHALAPFCATLVGDSAPESTAREAAAFLRAPLRLWGGAAQLWDLMRTRAEAGGGQVLGGRCSNLRLEKKGVVVDIDGAEVRATAVVLALSPERIAQLCEKGGRVEQKLAEEARLGASRKVALAHFVVRAEGIPQALEEAALLFSNGEALLVACLPARRAKGESAGERLVTLARVVEAGFTDGAALLRDARSALEPVLPFFDRHVVHEAADVDPVHGQRLLEPSGGLHAEPIGLRAVSQNHERILFASREVYPGFGLEGSILAARAATDHALELSGRKQVAAT
jgi:glycine/D-amino acid oxidase-like deaminating enzyme